MTRSPSRLGLLLLFALLPIAAQAQPPMGFGGPGGPGGPGGFGPGGNREDRKLVKKFDQDDNGWLNQQERVEARAAAKADVGQRRGFGPPGGGRFNRGDRPAPEPGPRIAPDEVEKYVDAGLYEPNVLRTLFLEFDNDDWEQELEDFHGTDVDVPAKLTVDGKQYQNVGVRFRGMSSYGMVPTGQKRSFNVDIDLAEDDQRLYGYKTLNLLNCAGDPSFMSTVLYSHIAAKYIPVPKANHVRVVINGESWGVYANVQQFDKEFLAEHYSSSKGTRWKVSGNPGADGGLRYLGEDLAEYKSRFDMKSNDGAKAWAALVKLCRTLNETPLDQLEDELESLLDIDETLCFLALDVALVNSDGYWTRASDYYLFLDSEKKFHVIPHDMNEAFADGRGGGRGPGGPPPGMGGMGPGRFGPPGDRDPRPADGQEDPAENERPFAGRGPNRGGFGPEGFGPGGMGPDQRGPRRGPGGPGGFGGPGGPGHGGVDLDPLVSIDNPRMPLRSRLLALPHLREKYLQYLREIAEKSLAPENVAPVIAQHAKLIEQEIAGDTRKLDSLEAFQKATALQPPAEGSNSPSLLGFCKDRRKFLLEYKAPAISEPAAE